MALGKIIGQLRRRDNLSQEQFAELFEVSQQSVQKWETGVTVPNLEKLVKIARYFDISLDTLVLSEEGEFSAIRRYQPPNSPRITVRYSWEIYCGFMKWEYQQSMEEGLDLETYKEAFDAVSRLPYDEPKRRMADALFETIMDAKRRPDYKYIEPVAWDELRALRAPFTKPLKKPNRMKDRIEGAWWGKAAGLLLGRGICGLRGEERESVLSTCGNLPLHRYMCSADITPELKKRYGDRLRKAIYPDTIETFPYDGRLNYPVLVQMMIKRYGKGFTAEDVARMWMDHLRKEICHTAERVAFRNFINGYLPPESAVHKNPFREWVGARNRADYYGYINPAAPGTAAAMVWRDASATHTKNGIYSAMLLAAMIAAAAATQDPEEILQYGMAEIPATSRLYERLDELLTDYRMGCSHKDFLKKLYERYNEFNGHDWCLAVPNTLIVAAALLYGEGDFGKTICLAVGSGFEAICNGSAIGSLMGMICGRSGIDPYWLEPISETFHIQLFGKEEISFAACIETTMEHLKGEKR